MRLKRWWDYPEEVAVSPSECVDLPCTQAANEVDSSEAHGVASTETPLPERNELMTRTTDRVPPIVCAPGSIVNREPTRSPGGL